MEINVITGFFDRYHTFYGNEVEAELLDFQHGLQRLIDGFEQIRLEALAEEREAAPAFNVFSILRLERSEVRTHSAMLAHLLRPSASHGQGMLFLQAFIDHCASRFPDFPRPSGQTDTEQWHVQTERHTSYGNLDVLIANPYLNYLVVIENKVGASEQPDQLHRYSLWLKSQEDNFHSQALIFLTVSGYKAFSAGGAQYYPLSYRHDISAWLSQTITAIQAPSVKQIVQQYLNLIRTF